MKQQNREHPPKILYKYREPFTEYLIHLLSYSQLYFSTTDQLNDPCERFFTYTQPDWMPLTEDELKFLKIEKTPKGSYHLSIDQRNALMYWHMKNRKEYGIFSLSKSNNSIAMFSHYAKGHTGLCIGFDWEGFELTFAGSDQKNIPHKISYKETPLEIHGIHGTPEDWQKVIRTKYTGFSFEEEYRIFYTKGPWLSPTVRTSIREIVFGYKSSREYREYIARLLSDLKDVKYLVAKPKIGTYELELVPYPFNKGHSLEKMTFLELAE